MTERRWNRLMSRIETRKLAESLENESTRDDVDQRPTYFSDTSAVTSSMFPK